MWCLFSTTSLREFLSLWQQIIALFSIEFAKQPSWPCKDAKSSSLLLKMLPQSEYWPIVESWTHPLPSTTSRNFLHQKGQWIGVILIALRPITAVQIFTLPASSTLNAFGDNACPLELSYASTGLGGLTSKAPNPF